MIIQRIFCDFRPVIYSHAFNFGCKGISAAILLPTSMKVKGIMFVLLKRLKMIFEKKPNCNVPSRAERLIAFTIISRHDKT